MRHPHGSVLVIPLHPRKLVLPGVLLAGLLLLLLDRPGSTEARYAPVPGDPPPELRLVPPDTIAVLHVNVAGMINKDLAKAVLSFVGGAEKMGAREFGAPLAEIDSFALLGGERSNLTVVTTRRACDSDKVRQALAPRSSEQTHKDKKFYAEENKFKDGGKFPKKDDFRKDDIKKDGFKEGGFAEEQKEVSNVAPWSQAVYFLNDRTYVTGNARSIMHFIDRAEKPTEKHPLHDALSVAGKHHVTLGFQVPEELSREASSDFRRMARDPWSGMILYNFKPIMSTRTGVMTADLGDDIRVEGTLGFADGRTASQAADSVRTSLMLARGALLMFEEQFNEGTTPKPDSAVSKLADQLRLALNEATVKADGSTVKASLKAQIDTDLVKQIAAEALPRVQQAANKAAAVNNLKQITLAIIKTADDNDGKMPDAVVYSKDGKPLYSWRVLILRNMEEGALYNKLKLDEPWDSEHNKPLLAKTPRAFQTPGADAGEGKTFFQIFAGAGTMTTPQRRVRFPASFPDGCSQTILVAEAAEAVHWAAPQDIPYSAKVSPLKQIGKHYGKGRLASMADGSVRTIPPTVREEDLRNAITPDDGNIIGESFWGNDERDFRGGGTRIKEKVEDKVKDKR